MPLHIRAAEGDVAPVALLVGEPARARRIAESMEAARCYNEHRGLLGHTGTYRGVPVSAQTTGMGGPSAAIVVEELADLGVHTVIRLGTCGAIAERVRVLDLVVATAAVPMDGTTRQYVDGDPFAPVAAFEVTKALSAAAGMVSRPAHVGLLVSQDAFYRQPADWERWRQRGVLAVEMEAAAIFTVALHRGLEAGALCLVVDDVSDRSSWASDEAIAAASGDLVRVGLEAAFALSQK